MTDREIFDKVKNHLLTQNCQSLGENDHYQCKYRGANNTSCAVGCLIPDEYYDPIIEGRAVGNTTEHKGNLKIKEILTKIGITYEQIPLLKNLQNIHDKYTPIEWRGMLDSLEKNYFNN